MLRFRFRKKFVIQKLLHIFSKMFFDLLKFKSIFSLEIYLYSMYWYSQSEYYILVHNYCPFSEYFFLQVFSKSKKKLQK